MYFLHIKKRFNFFLIFLLCPSHSSYTHNETTDCINPLELQQLQKISECLQTCKRHPSQFQIFCMKRCQFCTFSPAPNLCIAVIQKFKLISVMGNLQVQRQAGFIKFLLRCLCLSTISNFFKHFKQSYSTVSNNLTPFTPFD